VPQPGIELHFPVVQPGFCSEEKEEEAGNSGRKDHKFSGRYRI
jgi:hypothetical protein